MARKDALLRLHSRLVVRRDALRKALAGDLDSLNALRAMNDVGDSVDAAVDSANEEISSQIAEIESRELAQIEHALHRMGEGNYGQCEFCNGKIAVARLNALPYTSSCIDCQREQERMGHSGMSRAIDYRWADISDRHFDEGDRHINLSDYEMDMSESGR
ncbi:TraR/DksA family transcriptional regulator [Tautonia plasticadhaerens]|uniref:RNA polymerase-binding transcription factor n=1 Tax=Tautonia plasticadhaerens TaxID=2527974 RepID=A0A518HAF3_9BACT|nr:TraR/DksA family transcriptional regulator [Tautonia plasticadhaerens]QDV37830.1 RNA polymerase-binding transcription factor [Tautonia plasticadhaerens]